MCTFRHLLIHCGHHLLCCGVVAKLASICWFQNRCWKLPTANFLQTSASISMIVARSASSSSPTFTAVSVAIWSCSCLTLHDDKPISYAKVAISTKQSLHKTLWGPVSGMRSCLEVADRKASKQLKMFLDVSAPSSLLSFAATNFLLSLHHPSVIAIAVVRI